MNKNELLKSLVKDLDNMSKEDIIKDLKLYGVSYEDMRNLTTEEQASYNQVLLEMSEPTGVKLFDDNKYGMEYSNNFYIIPNQNNPLKVIPVDDKYGYKIKEENGEYVLTKKLTIGEVEELIDDINNGKIEFIKEEI